MEALDALRVGAELTLKRNCTRKDTGATWNPSTVTCFVYERDRHTTGTADAGTGEHVTDASHIVDSALTQAASFWVGQTLLVTDATDGTEVPTEVTAFDATTDKLTFGELPFVVAVGDTYELLGYPIIPEAAGSVAANVATLCQLTAANGATARPRDLVIVAHYDMGTDSFVECYAQTILPTR